MTIETSGTTDVYYGGDTYTADISIAETYGAAFTTDDGSALTFINLKRTTPGQSSITGNYAGGDDLCIEILATTDIYVWGVYVSTLTLMEETITADISAAVNNDGTWDGTGTIFTDGYTIEEGSSTEETSQDISGNWTAEDNMLVEFYGDYYLPQVYEDFVFTRQ